MANIVGTEFEIQDPGNNLTPRQREVLVWVVEGKENDAIAMILGITLGTVKFHIISLLRRFEAHNRQLLISRAWKLGLVTSRQLAITLLILGNVLPGTDDQPATVRTPRIARIRIGRRRDDDTHPIIDLANLTQLQAGAREAA